MTTSSSHPARPSLLVIASTFPSGPTDGTPAFVRDLAERVAEDFDVTLLVPRVPGSARTEQVGRLKVERFGYFLRRWEDLADGAIIENLRAKPSRWLQVPFFFLFEALALRRLVRRLQPDLLHVHWIVPQGIVASVAAKQVPALLTTLGGDVYALKDPLSRRLKCRAISHARVVTTMNSDMRSRLIELGAAQDSTFVLPMGAQIGQMTQFIGLDRDPRRLLFVGRLVEKKGLGVLLEALRSLPDELPWTLDVVGDGPLRAQLETQAASLGDRVRFLGMAGREDLGRAYATCGLLLMPSVPAASGDQDGLPVTLLEAMSLETPVIASNLPGIDDALDHGGAGRLVPPGDASALAAAIAELLADPAGRRALGKAARVRSADFSVDSIGARYSALLSGILHS